MSNQILLKRRQVGEDAPTNLDLSLGELAVNTVTGKLFMKNNDEAVIELSSVVLKSTYDSSNDRFLINDSFQSTLLLHKGLTYTFGISGNTIYGVESMKCRIWIPYSRNTIIVISPAKRMKSRHGLRLEAAIGHIA